MREIDLHVHTNISDGTFTPEETVRHAKKLGLRAIAVSDHDSTNGVARALSEGEKQGIEVVPALELGCGWYGKEVHMLGYFVDPANEKLRSTLQWIIDDRHERNRKMADRISADGIRIDLAELEERFRGSSIGRPHFARCIVEAGYAVSVQDAFHRYLNPGCKYYIRRNFLSIEEAASLIRGAGGKPVLAHPRQYRMDDEHMTELMERIKNAGVVGMECRYSGYDGDTVAMYEDWAARYGLCVTGGSDWHGENKPHIQMGSGINGELSVPYELLTILRERI